MGTRCPPRAGQGFAPPGLALRPRCYSPCSSPTVCRADAADSRRSGASSKKLRWRPSSVRTGCADAPTECAPLLACFFPSYAPGSGDTAPARVAGAPSGTARGRPDSHSRLVLRGGSGAFWGSPPVKVTPRNIHLPDARASLSSWPPTSRALRALLRPVSPVAPALP
jgi:hypothetical protein